MAPNPVYQKEDGKWYHTTPSYKDEFGPFDTAEEAWAAFRAYMKSKL